MKNKIINLTLSILFLCNSLVYANYAVFYSDRLNITVSNINENISKIELLSIERCIPSEIFEYELVKKYGYYYERDNYGIEIPIWDKNDIVKDKKNDRIEYFKGDKDLRVYGNEEEVRLYKVSNYDKSKYILTKLGEKNPGYTMNGINYSTYYDSDKNLFSLVKIKASNNIDEYKINNGTFELSIKDLKLYGRKDRDYNSKEYIPSFYLRFYKENGEFKDIAVGSNSYQTTDYGAISTLSKSFDYKTGAQITIQKNSKFLGQTITLVIEIGIAMLLTIIIELLVAKKMKISNYNTIVKVNIFTQLLFHIVFLIPQTYLGISLVTLIGMVLYNLIDMIVGYMWAELITLILSVVVIELIIVIIEFLLYKKSIKEESKKRLFKYAFLANLASFALSVVVLFVSMIFSY